MLDKWMSLTESKSIETGTICLPFFDLSDPVYLKYINGITAYEHEN